jgi:hypothetical protein
MKPEVESNRGATRVASGRDAGGQKHDRVWDAAVPESARVECGT